MKYTAYLLTILYTHFSTVCRRIWLHAIFEIYIHSSPVWRIPCVPAICYYCEICVEKNSQWKFPKHIQLQNLKIWNILKWVTVCFPFYHFFHIITVIKIKTVRSIINEGNRSIFCCMVSMIEIFCGIKIKLGLFVGNFHIIWMLWIFSDNNNNDLFSQNDTVFNRFNLTVNLLSSQFSTFVSFFDDIRK